MILFYKKEIALLISCVFSSLDKKEIINLIDKPPKREMGDYAFPCFRLARVLKQDPRGIAKDFALSCPKNKHFSKIEARGPYINFYLKKQDFIKLVLEWTLEINKNSFRNIGKDSSIVIDFSSPNIAKPFSVAHLRSTSIGNSLYNIFSFLGYKVIRINHLGDWGTSFGKLISAYRRWGKDINLEENPTKKLLDLYIKFHKEVKTNKSLEEEARGFFKELEDGDEEILAIWNKFRHLSLKEFKRIYKLLNVSFDHYLGESFYIKFIPGVLEEIEDKRLASRSEGALLIPFEEASPFLLKKQDDTSLYGTRDIACAIYRKEQFNFDKMLYVVGNEQSLYFSQLFKVLKLMGYNFNCEHIKFGLMHFKEGKMSSREGNIIFLEEVINKSKLKALEKIELNEKEDKIKLSNEEKEELASKIGISSVLFFDLKNTREKDSTFDWDEVLNPKGETGIYLQYAHARLCGILENFERQIGTLPPTRCPDKITEDKSFELACALALFKDKLLHAANAREPSIIAGFALELAQSFSSYYKQYQVVDLKNKDLSYERVISVIASKKILAFALELLGIEPLSRI